MAVMTRVLALLGIVTVVYVAVVLHRLDDRVDDLSHPTPTPSASATAPVPEHGCLPPLCRILTPKTSASPSPRATPTRASRSRSLAATATGSLLDVTCYSATGSRTASGKWPRVGMAASNRHPFGTRLLVQGVGVVTVEDRIGHGSQLDLFGPSESYCRTFGRQQLRVEVLR